MVNGAFAVILGAVILMAFGGARIAWHGHQARPAPRRGTKSAGQVIGNPELWVDEVRAEDVRPPAVTLAPAGPDSGAATVAPTSAMA